jgi:hypothetical protein
LRSWRAIQPAWLAAKAPASDSLSYKNLDKPLWFLKDNTNAVNYYSNRGEWEGNYLKLSPEEAQEFIITITEKTEGI